MPLTLSGEDLARLEHALRTLLSPLDWPMLDHWRSAVNDSVCHLLGAEKAAFLLAVRDQAPVLVSGIEEATMDAYFRYFAPLDVGLQRRERMGLDVWSTLELQEAALHHRSEIWNDWKAPNQLWGATGLMNDSLGVPAGVVVYDAMEDAVLEERQVALLRLVRSAFDAGVRTYLQLGSYHGGLARALDGRGDAVALFDLRGRLLHANPALLGLLEREPRREAVEEEMHVTAALLGDLAASPRKSCGSELLGLRRVGEVEVGGRYRVTGSFVGEDLLGPGQLVLISVATLRRPLPTADVLRERFGLTRKEAAVALLLAAEKTNEEIAAALYVSPHTARHHTESIFLKLGVHSRLEVARLLREL